MSSTSKEILRGLAAAISAFVPTYQRGQMLQAQQRRNALAEKRAQARDRRSEESHQLLTQIRRAVLAKKRAGRPPLTRARTEEIEALISQFGGPDKALAHLDSQLQRWTQQKQDVSVPEMDPMTKGLPGAELEVAKAQREAQSYQDSLQNKINRAWEVKRALEIYRNRQAAPQPEASEPQAAPVPAQEAMRQRQAAQMPDNPSAPGFGQYDAQSRDNFAQAWKDKDNPNLPLIDRIRAWLVLEQFGVEIPAPVRYQMMEQGFLYPQETPQVGEPSGRVMPEMGRKGFPAPGQVHQDYKKFR